MSLHGRQMKVTWGHDTAIGRAIPTMPALMQFGLREEIFPQSMYSLDRSHCTTMKPTLCTIHYANGTLTPVYCTLHPEQAMLKCKLQPGTLAKLLFTLFLSASVERVSLSRNCIQDRFGQTHIQLHFLDS